MTSFYDGGGVAQRYSEHRHGGSSSPNHVMEEPAFLEVVGDVADLNILDLGCGDAGFGRIASAIGCRSYLGVDSSSAMASQARRALAGRGGQVRQEAIEELELPQGSVDLIVSRLAMHYVEDLHTVLVCCRH